MGCDWDPAATFHDLVEREARADYDPFPDDERPTEAELALEDAPWFSVHPPPPSYQRQDRQQRDQEQKRVDDHAASQGEDKQDHDDCDEHD